MQIRVGHSINPRPGVLEDLSHLLGRPVQLRNIRTLLHSSTLINDLDPLPKRGELG